MVMLRVARRELREGSSQNDSSHFPSRRQDVPRPAIKAGAAAYLVSSRISPDGTGLSGLLKHLVHQVLDDAISIRKLVQDRVLPVPGRDKSAAWRLVEANIHRT